MAAIQRWCGHHCMMPQYQLPSVVVNLTIPSGNVQCLDVLRAMHKEPETVAVLFGELNAAKGLDKRYDQLLAWIDEELSDRSQIEARARRIVEALGLALQAAILLQHGDPAVRDAFCSSRLAGK